MDQGRFSPAPGPRQHGMQHHCGTGMQVGRVGILDFVVADAALARHEDHGGRAASGHIDRIMSRTAGQCHEGMALGDGLILNEGTQLLIEGAGREMRGLREADPYTVPLGNRLRTGLLGRGHCIQGVCPGIAPVSYTTLTLPPSLLGLFYSRHVVATISTHIYLGTS